MKSLSHTFFPAKAFACALLAAMASTPATFAEASAPVVATKTMEWRTDLPAALADAAKQDKTVLLRFTAKWCAPCRVMDARVWPDPDVQAALAGKFILVKSDIDEETSQVLARKFGVRGVPALLLLDGKGSEITRGGFMSTAELLKLLAPSGPVPPQP